MVTEVPPLLLVVEDDTQMRKFLRASLSSNGYRLVEAATGAEGLTQAASYNPDLILLDLGLPDIDGLVVTQRLREWASAPIIVISARGQEDDKIHALDSGADDYLTKPFGTGELLARIRVALRHAARSGSERNAPTITVGELSVDLDKRTVHVGGKELTHRQLLKEVWGPGYANNTQYLRVYMVQLRHKLEQDAARPRYLLTEPGVGYRLK